MLKKVLCLVIIAMTLVATLAVANVGAAQADNSKKTVCKVGDVDCDEKITIKDASTIQKAIAGIVKLSDRQLPTADTNDDGVINVKDVTVLQRYLAGIEDNDVIGSEIEYYEPVEKPDENKKPSNIDNNKKVEETSIEKAVAEKFLEYVNEERVKVGVAPLRVNNCLTKAALLRGDEIVESFSHTRPDGSSCFTAVEGDVFHRLGENIAYNAGIIHFYEGMSAKALEEEIDYAARFFFGQFKGSEGHYKNMINENFNCTGIGVNFVVHDGYIECNIAHMFGEKI